ncbi:MAG TPA: HAD family phosphatase [Tepidanaerobacter syntrophicus]|uniref:HAD-IIB family hydrolase n=1 Tax=Tepidanaerobacter syntrophicus TaxID=224999 RepID=UPI00175971B8|nr:HAD family phosphatase [Tepidanaerobacter syntrophicus]
MAIKLIALDIDGTVADGDNNVSLENERAIKKAMERGAKIALVTGRHRDGLKKVMDVLGLDFKITPLVLNNGALIYWQGELIWEDLITPKEADGVIKFSGKMPDVAIVTFRAEDIEMYCGPLINKEWLLDRLSAFEINPKKVTKNPDELTRENVAKIMLVVENGERALEIYSIWPKELSSLKRTRSYPYLCEINSGTCDKGRGIKILCEKIGVLPEEVLAVGDGESDVPMLSFAKNAVFVRHFDWLPKLPTHVEVAPKEYRHTGAAWAIEKYIDLFE